MGIKIKKNKIEKKKKKKRRKKKKKKKKRLGILRKPIGDIHFSINFLFYDFDTLKQVLLRGVFFNSCHLLDYFSRGLPTKMLFICGENPIFSDQISIKIVAV